MSTAQLRVVLGVLVVGVAVFAGPRPTVGAAAAAPNGVVTPGPPTAVPHQNHAAVVLDGPACRGLVRPAYCGQVLVVGGGGPSELYDPRSGTWMATGSLNLHRSYHSLTLIDPPLCHVAANDGDAAAGNPPDWCGKVLVAGGGADYEDYVNITATAELYDPATGTWTPTADMHQARGLHAAALLPDGQVLVVGGSSVGNGGGGLHHLDEREPLETAETFDPRTGTWTDAGTTPAARGEGSSAVLSGPACSGVRPAAYCGRVLVAGGDSGAADVFDPVTRTWTDSRTPADPGAVAVSRLSSGAPASTLAQGSRLAELADGRVLASGGGGTEAQTYDPAAAAWSRTGSLHVARSHQTATRIDGAGCGAQPAPSVCGKVLVVGGAADAPAEVFDPVAGTWSSIGPPLQTRYVHTTTLLPDGTLLVVDGSDDDDPNVAEHVASVLLIQPPWGGSNTAARPWVGSVAPGSLPSTGGTSVVVLGQGFDQVREVRIGGAKAPSFVVELPTRLRLVAPAQAVGRATVEVQVAGGGRSPATPSAESTYVEPRSIGQPRVSNLDPRAGYTGGGTTVTIRGSGFAFPAGDTTVRFGDALAAKVTILSENRIVAVTPPGAAGPAPLRIMTPAGALDSTAPEALFDYGPGMWSSGRPLTSCPETDQRETSGDCARRSHATATVLDGRPCHESGPPGWCGDVLVTGGARALQCGTTLALAERYDPARATWSPTGGMSVPRFAHTATALADGRVLVVGGKPGISVGEDQCDKGLSSAEVYDPGKGEWSPAGRLPAAGRGSDPEKVFDHTATLLDGPACRSKPAAVWCGKVLIAGGTEDENFHPGLNQAVLYDPATRSFSPTSPLAVARSGHTATLLPDGRVLVAGGFDGSGAEKFPVEAEIYDPATGTWSSGGKLAIGRSTHTATLLQGDACGPNCGKVMVAGGMVRATRGTPLRFVAAAELYDPSTNEWLPTGPMNVARGGHTASVLPDGYVLVAGGAPTFPQGGEGFHRVEPTAELYDPVAGRWSFTSSLGTPRGNQAAAVLSGPPCRGDTSSRPSWCGVVLILGGTVSGNGHAPDVINNVELYGPRPIALAKPGGGTPILLWCLVVVAAAAAFVVRRRRDQPPKGDPPLPPPPMTAADYRRPRATQPQEQSPSG